MTDGFRVCLGMVSHYTAELEEASTHKSAMTQGDTVFVTPDFDL